jgi:hypothetical protein
MPLPIYRYTFYLLLALCLGSCATAEVPEFEGVPDYTEVYHPFVDVAELNILNGAYEDALTAYKQAFASVPAPFARDYYNAAVCATQLNDEKQAFHYLEQLVLKGVSLPYLERQEVFDTLQTSGQWKKFARKYPKLRDQYEQTVDRDLRADLDELYARDLYFRNAKGGLRVHGDTIRKIEEANLQNLLAHISERGYPGEGLIGVADTLEQLPRFSIVIQRQTKSRKGYDFTDILTTAVKEGRIAPQPAAYLLDQQAGRNIYGSRAFSKVTCVGCKEEQEPEKTENLLVEKASEKQLERVDERREKLGLEPLAHYRKKVQYNEADKRFRLGYTWSVKNYIVPSSEAARVMMDRLTTAE